MFRESVAGLRCALNRSDIEPVFQESVISANNANGFREDGRNCSFEPFRIKSIMRSTILEKPGKSVPRNEPIGITV